MKALFLVLCCLLVAFGFGYWKGQQKGQQLAQAEYEKKMSDYSILFVPKNTQLANNSRITFVSR